MASLAFSYRSRKPISFLEVRLSFRIKGQNLDPQGKEVPYSYYTRSKISVSKEFWSAYKLNKQFRDIDRSNQKQELDNQIHELKTHVLEALNRIGKDNVTKQWFDKVVMDYYSPKKLIQGEVIPNILLDYWDYYLNLRHHEIGNKIRRFQKWITIKNKVARFQKEYGKTFEIKDVNDNFKKDFVEYCQSENYSPYTIQKEFSYIKTVCTHARSKGVEVSRELDTLKLNLNKPATDKVYLTRAELDQISKLQGLTNYLDNARDWLIISCYTGQRISDFMRFNKSMIRYEKNIPFLDLKQVKTGKDVTVPLLPEVMQIIEKRNGDFPHPISHQRYNDWIKEVAKLAGLTQSIKAGRRVNNRKVKSNYPKWQLVTSHIGRRSFATYYYGKIPTSYLKDITAHGTEQMLLAYIGKSTKDTAHEAYKLMINV
jgi:integrase